MLALLTCDAVPPINTVTYFVSVFFDLRLVAVALGNIGVVIAVGALQLVFVTLLHRRQQMSAASSNDAHRHTLLVDLRAYLEDAALCRFPALAVQLMSLLLPGSLRCFRCNSSIPAHNVYYCSLLHCRGLCRLCICT